MILKNTPANRKLVNRLSDCISDTTAYFRTSIDKRWNLGKDIRFEITSVGEDNPVLISTCCTADGRFRYKVRLLSNQIENDGDLVRLAFRLSDAEKMLLNLRSIIEHAHPATSEIE